MACYLSPKKSNLFNTTFYLFDEFKNKYSNICYDNDILWYLH